LRPIGKIFIPLCPEYSPASELLQHKKWGAKLRPIETLAFNAGSIKPA
jgi:hypothetical protein